VLRGPAWSIKGLDQADSRYPLRVERHLGRLVDGLLPGVITTTGHARAYALHTLAWAEATKRGLESEEANAFLRRCEVVWGAITLLHESHGAVVPGAHGGDAIERGIESSGQVLVAQLAERYTPNAMGFGGVYLGSEIRLGLLENGRPPRPGPRANETLLHEALGTILELADEEALALETLRGLPHLCACGAPAHADGPWLRKLFVNPDPTEGLEAADRPRRDTARLLCRVLAGGVDQPTQEAFRVQVAYGDFIETDPVARTLPIAQAWRGAILRNYSVGAWRRLWAWVVELLAEPASIGSLAEQLAATLPDMSVAEMLDGLPARLDAATLLPVERELRRAQFSPDPLTEIQLLALGAQRVDDLQSLALRAFVGREDEDDLGPRWFKAQLEARRDDRLQDFGRWLTEVMVLRAQRVALSKLVFNRNTGRFWIPSRIRERAGLISRLSREGWGDVGLRIDTFASVLSGCGVIERTSEGVWRVTGEGERLLA
jgi:hypothetical protein